MQVLQPDAWIQNPLLDWIPVSADSATLSEGNEIQNQLDAPRTHLSPHNRHGTGFVGCKGCSQLFKVVWGQVFWLHVWDLGHDAVDAGLWSE